MSINFNRDKLSLLSKNLVQVIDALGSSEPIAKTTYFTTNDPLSKNKDKDGSLFDSKSLTVRGDNQRIFPYPFNVDFKDEKNVYIHVYYPDIEFKNNEHVEQAILFFDIVCHRDHWLYIEDEERLIRPYEIASYISRVFDGTIDQGTIGKMNFQEVTHVTVNEQYDAVRLITVVTSF